nr:hypothetical protein [Morchella crassipes]
MEKGEGCRSNSPPPFSKRATPGRMSSGPPHHFLKKIFPPPSLGPLGPGKREGGRRGGDGHFFNKMTYPPPPPPPVLFNFHFLMKACFPTLRKHVLPEYQAKLR